MAFEDVTGHGRQKRFLTALLSGERMPHALLFTGQDGIGKRTMALALAKAVLCKEGTGCGRCTACAKVAKGLHPDLRVVGSEGTIGVDEVRGDREKRVVGINQEVFERPFEANRRVILIDNAHSMRREAANALLKTLEEPPPFNLFILVTSCEKDVPRTIRSRCSRVAFSPLSKAELRGFLTGRHACSGERADFLSAVSMGSVASALFWMDQGNLAVRRKLAEVVLAGTGGRTGASAAAEMVARNEQVMMYYLFFLLALFRDLYVVAHRLHGDVVMNVDLVELMQSKAVKRQWVLKSMKALQETIGDMRYNVNRWLAIENLLVRIMREA
jgi:DNA polymerase III subunit delta'